MLYTKFKGHWPAGFRAFKRGFTIYGHGSHLRRISDPVCTILVTNGTAKICCLGFILTLF